MLLWKMDPKLWNFSIFHDLQSDLKVSEMGWEVKKWSVGFQSENKNCFTMGAVRIEFAALFLEPGLPAAP